MKLLITFMLLVLVVPATRGAENEDRFIQQIQVAKQRTVVVAEGDFEPRSIGSYSVRIYNVTNPAFLTDDFAGGVIRERDGVVESVVQADLNGDQQNDLIIAIRCVGSGNYLSADAFDVSGQKPVLIASFAGQEPNVDPVGILREQILRTTARLQRQPGTTESVEAKVQVFDKDGHGPDVGSREWLSAVHRLSREQNTK